MDVKPLVLVIEDEEVIQNFIATVLGSNGFRVVKAGSWARGVIPHPIACAGCRAAGFGPSGS